MSTFTGDITLGVLRRGSLTCRDQTDRTNQLKCIIASNNPHLENLLRPYAQASAADCAELRVQRDMRDSSGHACMRSLPAHCPAPPHASPFTRPLSPLLYLFPHFFLTFRSFDWSCIHMHHRGAVHVRCRLYPHPLTRPSLPLHPPPTEAQASSLGHSQTLLKLLDFELLRAEIGR